MLIYSSLHSCVCCQNVMYVILRAPLYKDIRWCIHPNWPPQLPIHARPPQLYSCLTFAFSQTTVVCVHRYVCVRINVDFCVYVCAAYQEDVWVFSASLVACEASCVNWWAFVYTGAPIDFLWMFVLLYINVYIFVCMGALCFSFSRRASLRPNSLYSCQENSPPPSLRSRPMSTFWLMEWGV